MPTSPARPTTALLLGAFLTVFGAACVDATVIEGADGADEPTATTSTVVEAGGTLELGAAATTPRGNTVAVVDAEASPAGVHGLVEACAGPEAEGDVGVSLSLFALQLRDRTVVRPMEPDEAREPPLRTRQIEPDTCTVGWVSFDVAESDQPDVRYLVFGSPSAPTRWDLSDVSG
jgi:hypothetical protein